MLQKLTTAHEGLDNWHGISSDARLSKLLLWIFIIKFYFIFAPRTIFLVYRVDHCIFWTEELLRGIY